MMRKLKRADFVRVRTPYFPEYDGKVGRIVEVERPHDGTIRYWVSLDDLDATYPYNGLESHYFRHYELRKVRG